MDKVKAAEQFLKSLEDSNKTMDIMLDRMDESILKVINNYAKLVSEVQNKSTKLNTEDVVNCALIIGYLLKTHVDRYELEQSFN